MIAIVNVAKDYKVLVGEQDYEVRINRQVIAKFKHQTEHGLAVCLQKAAEAVKKSGHKNTLEVLLGLSSQP